MKLKKIISFIFLSLLLVLTSCKDKECKHKSTTWIIDKEASCLETGLKHKECDNCHEKLNEEIIGVIVHNYENGECTRCHKKLSIGLEYKLNEDNNSYSVVGIGSCIDIEIVIPDTYNELPVTIIEDSLFESIDSLLSIEIPSSIIKIGNMGDLENIENIEIGTIYYNGTIEDWCDVALNSGIFLLTKHICMLNNKGEYEELTEITLPYTLTKVEDCQFAGFHTVTKVTLPNSITSIGFGSFAGCSNLKNIEIPNSVTSIREWAFSECSSLISAKISSSVTSIGEGAFSGCSSLVTVINNSDLELTFENANNGYIASNSYKIINKDGSITYRDEDRYTYIETEDNFLFRYDFYNRYQLVAYLGTEDTVTLPEDINGISYNICGMKGVRNVIIPDTFTSIGDYAFSGCSSLTSIIFNENSQLTSIGESAFAYCISLISIDIPNSVTSIGYGAFDYCSSLTSINIPNSVTSIETYAFSRCSSLEDIYYDGTIEDWCNINVGFYSISYIKDFYMKNSNGEYEELTEIEIPNTITEIGNHQFQGFNNVTKITISNSVTSIGDNAFGYCTNLTSIEIPNSVTSIGDNAFRYCTNLTSIEIPNSVTNIGSSAFSGCSSLTSIEIPNSVTSIGYSAFYNCTSLTSIVLPNSVTSIGFWAFDGCSSLTIYCEALSQPDGWISSWNPSNCPVIWDYKSK